MFKTVYPRKVMKPSEIWPGDVVSPEASAGSPFMTSIVRYSDGQFIYLWRPFGTTYGMQYGANSRPYIGVEEYEIECSANGATFFVHERQVWVEDQKDGETKRAFEDRYEKAR